MFESRDTYLNVIDNYGAKIVFCIKVVSSYKKCYAKPKDIIIVYVKALLSKRKYSFKVKKGCIYKVTTVRTKSRRTSFLGDSFNFFENSVILLNDKPPLFFIIHIFGLTPKFFRYSKVLKIISLVSGLNFLKTI